MSISFTRASVGGLLTAGMYNQLIDAWSSPICRATVTSPPQSTSGTVNTNTAVLFNVNTYDTSAMHSTTTNTSRITIPAGWGGFYLAFGRVRLAAGTAQLVTQFGVNGVVQGTTADRTGGFGATVSGAFGKAFDVFQLNAGDYVELFVQSDTASQGLVLGNCMFSLAFIHA